MEKPSSDAAALLAAATLPDEDVVARVRAGDHFLFELLMRRHNQRLYRAVRAIVANEQEVEDVMQQAYINAFVHLHQFENRARFSTWLTRIALNEAFGRRRRMRASEAMMQMPSGPGDGAEFTDTITSPHPDPERQAYAQELHHVLEDIVDTLPETYRVVFMLRDVEGLSTGETGEGLGIGDEAVKTRLHRARALVRRGPVPALRATTAGGLPILAPRPALVSAA